ncbi:acetyltransferase [Variovorax ginsengisoli]|uniref:Acetyltransferase n=1 Tax=Variovorax ginsengisoli TaxID=363844 RepID=A0ABT8SDA7_9BURK|nr:acetyltransferase [Variovorax ginsengisoli]MDN8617545.1 acetyltransferase [Variovorax ginsengisoli]MDO1536715.1 acetyltransferase [Variovorax ginsengisoli]
MSQSVVIVGAGGHAKVCIELLRATGVPVACCIGGADSKEFCLDVAVLKGDHHLATLRERGHELAFVAIGSNALRQRLAATVRALGFNLVNAISPNAVVSHSARLGTGIAIMAGAVINADATIGDLSIINTLASVDHDGTIGEAVHIAPHCGLAGNVHVATRAFLGVGCKVLPGVFIGADAVAGAGSVIISNVAPNARIVGVPAKNLKERT